MPLREPKCVAIVLCDTVIEDKRTNNKTLVGLFNGIMVPTLPHVHPRLFVMASITGFEGPCPIGLRILGPSGKTLLDLKGDVQFPGPNDVVDMVIEVCGLPLEEAGVHFVDLVASGTPLAERRFGVAVAGGDSGR